MRDARPAATVADNTYRQIREDIIFGRLAPEEKLRLDRLRGRYGASVSTLREILNRLTSEGLVVAEGQRGFEVAPVSPESLKEIASLRLLLESHALELSFAAGDMEWEAEVVAAHHKLQATERMMASSDRSITETWKRYESQFHQAMIAACGSRALLDVHAGVFDKYLRYQMISLTFRGQIAADEHWQMREAALRRDAPAAQAILKRHIEGGVAHGLAAGVFGNGPKLAADNRQDGGRRADRIPSGKAHIKRILS
jgi:DNA-binding GntR family transcriptional regulator